MERSRAPLHAFTEGFSYRLLCLGTQQLLYVKLGAIKHTAYVALEHIHSCITYAHAGNRLSYCDS